MAAKVMFQATTEGRRGKYDFREAPDRLRSFVFNELSAPAAAAAAPGRKLRSVIDFNLPEISDALLSYLARKID